MTNGRTYKKGLDSKESFVEAREVEEKIQTLSSTKPLTTKIQLKWINLLPSKL